MKQTRRYFITTATAATAGLTMLPYAARAASHTSDVFKTPGGNITVHPISHASFVMETPVGTIYSDPVGNTSAYAGFPTPDLILITHEHGDHYNAETLAEIVGTDTRIIANPAVHSMLPDALAGRAVQIANGQSTTFGGISVEAIPAYNLTEERKRFHPEGRDNGYVLGFEGFRVYISGDTEDVPEMRALPGIDLAFLCMNLPFTMDVEAAASAIADFQPKYVYPYHYRGRGDGTQDPAEFARLVGNAVEVRLGDWYG